MTNNTIIVSAYTIRILHTTENRDLNRYFIADTKDEAIRDANWEAEGLIAQDITGFVMTLPAERKVTKTKAKSKYTYEEVRNLKWDNLFCTHEGCTHHGNDLLVGGLDGVFCYKHEPIYMCAWCPEQVEVKDSLCRDCDEKAYQEAIEEHECQCCGNMVQRTYLRGGYCVSCEPYENPNYKLRGMGKKAVL